MGEMNGSTTCSASPDHADILETIQNAADDWQKQGYTTALAEVRDMANVGRALMTAIADNAGCPPLKGWHPANCPSEIVSDLLNMLDDATRAAPPAMDREAVERETIERCARVAEDFEGTAAMERCDDPLGAAGSEIADSIRALSTLSADAIRQGCRMVPVEPTHEMIRAAAESMAYDDEGAFEPVMDLLGFSGENKTRTVLRQLLTDAIAAAPASHASDGGKA